jgi:hypothetical protein
MFDGQQLGEDVVSIVRSFMEREVAPLRAENAELKARVKALEDRPAPEVIIPELPEMPELPDFEAMIGEAVSKAVDALPRAKDGDNGVGLAGALIDRDGSLILTLTNGETRDLGKVVGKDGENGEPGLGFDDMDVAVLDVDRTIEFAFRRGDEVKAFTLKWPTPIDRGVWNEKTEYARGDAVTWGGSLWIAQKDTPTGKPDAPESGWRLSVKKGRDGKDAKNG